MDPGTVIERYRIVSLLGQGGMGEVYLAEDTALGRQVALKLLPPGLVADEDRRRRFIQEAKAASALNHPNILTIYEIGQSAGAYFIAAEHINGQTLRQHLESGRLSVRDSLDIAMQAAAGLAAAHAEGIVHRDIKPENMMLRRDGLLKILDFGLAKLTERTAAIDAATEVATAKTGAGVVMGTPRYMSPEQARGGTIDVRSDIFSLGAVVYETLAGRPAFEGETASHVIVSILEKEPPSLAQAGRDIPAELDRIVTKALSKDVDERYQSAKDLAVDLKRLRQRLDVDAELSRSTPSRGVTPAPPRRSRKAGVLVAGIAVLLALTAAGSYWWRASGVPAPSFEQTTITRLTSSGTVTQAAISPDGRYIVHVTNEAGQRSLWMRQIATGSTVQIAPPSLATFSGLAFSSDATFLYYTKTDPGQASTLYQMPVLGGASRPVLERVRSRVSFSPDGKRFAFVRAEPVSSGGNRLLVANADGTGERELDRVDAPDFFGDPSWSPDGASIAATIQSFAPDYHGSVYVIPAEGGVRKPLGTRTWYAVRTSTWLSGGAVALIAADAHEFPNAYQVWSVSYPAGEARKITNGLENHVGLGATVDGRSIISVLTNEVSNLSVFPKGDATNGKALTTGMARSDGAAGLDWTPDGRIVYTAPVGTRREMWIMNADGTGTRPLTADKVTNSFPSVCGDNARALVTSDRGGTPQVWRFDLDGSNPRQIVNAASGSQNPSCSPDGTWLVYQRFGSAGLWRVGIDGGDAQQLTKHDSRFPWVSPDGRSIAYSFSEGTTALPYRLGVIPAGGGAAVKVFDFPAPTIHQVRWTADGTALTYPHRTAGVDNLWIQRLTGGPPKQLTQFTSDLIFGHAWSRDGRLVVARGANVGDAVLIKAE